MIDPIDSVRKAIAILAAEDAAGDAYLWTGSSHEVAIVDGAVERENTEELRGLAIRFVKNGSVSFAYTTDLSDSGIASAVARARDIAPFLPPDPHFVLAHAAAAYPEVVSADLDFGRLGVEGRVELALSIERAARAFDRRVVKFRESAFHETEGWVAIANTNGVEGIYRYTRAYGSCECAAEDGAESQVGWGGDWARSGTHLDAETIGREAASRAIEKMGAKPWTTATCDVVLERRVAAELVASMANAFRADEVLRGKSLFRDRVGDRVASDAVVLVDDGTTADGAASARFDDEGVAMQVTTLVDRGMLREFLHDTTTAHRMGTSPTGNAIRESFTAPPKIGPTNLLIRPGSLAMRDLVREARNGIVITETMGMHTVDTVTGEFSVAANGLRIEDGKIAGGVTGVGLAGNLVDVLRQIVAVGSDFKSSMAGGGAPSRLVASLTVSGQ